MSSLLENAKNEALRRIPARFGGREDPVERVESRGRRTLNRVQAAGSRIRSGIGDAYDSAESRVRGEDPASRRRKRAAAATAAGAAGGAGAYFLDPISGKRRRHVARDKIASLFKRGEEAPEGTATATSDEARADGDRSKIQAPA